jgi:hypothetical protein
VPCIWKSKRCLIIVELLTVATFVVVIADEEYSKTHYYVPFIFSLVSQHTSKLVARENSCSTSRTC